MSHPSEVHAVRAGSQPYLSIGSLRALDTTRIFASRTINADSLEARLVRTFPPDCLLSRTGGGSPKELRELFISAEMKRRQLNGDAGAGGVDVQVFLAAPGE